MRIIRQQNRIMSRQAVQRADSYLRDFPISNNNSRTRKEIVLKRGFVIRFYRQFDAELIYLIERMIDEKIDVSAFIKSAVRCHIAGKEYSPDFSIKKLIEEKIDEPIELRKKIQFHLELKEDEDKDIIEYIYSIRKGYRCVVLKTILRQCAGRDIILACDEGTPVVFVAAV